MLYLIIYLCHDQFWPVLYSKDHITKIMKITNPSWSLLTSTLGTLGVEAWPWLFVFDDMSKVWDTVLYPNPASNFPISLTLACCSVLPYS